MNYVYALRLALFAMAFGVFGFAEAQINVYVRLASAAVTEVDSDDIGDDDGDVGAVGDDDEFRWLLRTTILDQNRRGSVDTVVLGRDGEVPGDPRTAEFGPGELDVLYAAKLLPGDGLPVARRYGATMATAADIRLGFILEGWEDDADLNAEVLYDADEDDFFDEVNTSDIGIADVAEATWTRLDEPVVTAGGRYAVAVEVYWEPYRASGFTTARRVGGGGVEPASRFCSGDGVIEIVSAFESPTVPYDGVSWDIETIRNGVRDFGYSISPTYPFFSVPRHSGRALPDTLELFLTTTTRFGFFFPQFYVSPPSDTVVVVLDPPALPAAAASARTPGLRCANYDGTPVTVTLAEGYDPLDYDYALLDYEDYDTGQSADVYTEGTRTPAGFVFAAQPDYYSQVRITPKAGGCPLLLDNPDVEFYEPEYEMSWEDVAVTAASAAAPGSIVADGASVALQPWYSDAHPPYRQEYFDPNAAAWVLVDAAAATPDFAVDVAAGEPYRLRVTDDLGCRLDTAGLVVGGPAAGPSIGEVRVGETCELGDGLAFVGVEGDYPGSPYFTFYLRGRTAAGASYDETDGSGTGQFDDVPPGRYAVGLVDVAGGGPDYERPDSVDVEAIAATDDFVLGIARTLFCDPDEAAVEVFLRDPVPSFEIVEYAFDGGPFGQATRFDLAAAGTYVIRARDPFACIVGDTAVGYDPADYVIQVADRTDADCGGTASGSVTFAEVPDFFAEWSLDGVDYVTARTFDALAPGNYTGYQRVNESCVTTVDFAIGGGGGTPLLDSLVAAPVSCFGGSDGTLVAYLNPNFSAVEFALDDGPYTLQASYPDLAPGTYTLSVREVGATCAQTYTATVTAPDAALEASYGIEVAPTCGRDNGLVFGFATGGTAPYTYLWSDGVTGSDRSDVGGGTLSLTVTDARGCSDTYGDIVPAGPTLELTVAGTTDNVCFGESRGAVALAATLPVTFSLADATSTDGTFDGLAAGLYRAYATSTQDGCRDSVEFRIEAPPVLEGEVAFRQNPTCAGEPDGQITLSASGGTGTAYTYSLDRFETSQTSPTFTDLPAGEYLPAVRDENGCFLGLPNVTLTVPSPLSIGFETLARPSCGEANGIAEAFVSGGTGTYQYQWSTGQTGARAEGLPSGKTVLTVTDEAGCTASAELELPASDALVLSVSSQTPASCGTANGSATVTVNRPGGDVTYTWPAGVSVDGATAFDLAAGPYTVTAVSADGCTAQLLVVVDAADGPEVTLASQTDADCDGTLGAATVTVSGGTGAVTLSWSSGDDGASAAGLAAGEYVVTATDANGCTGTLVVDIALAGALALDFEATPTGCDPGADGVIALVGAAPPGVTFELEGFSRSSETGDFADLPAGTYTVVSRSAGGCTDRDEVTVGELPTPIVDDVSSEAPTCATPEGGTIAIAATPGVFGTAVQYSVDGGASFQDSPTFTGLGAGTYPTAVRGAGGCVNEGTTVFFPDVSAGVPVIDDVATVSPTCAAPVGGSITVFAEGDGLSYSIDGGNAYRTDPSFGGLGAGTYTVLVRSGEGCESAPRTVTLEGPASAPTLAATTVALDTCGRGSGVIGVDIAGGRAPYTLTVGTRSFDDVAAGTRLVTGLSAGTYALSVTDANGCSASASADVAPLDGPVLEDITVVEPTCAAPAGGVITILASAGDSADELRYSIDAGASYRSSPTFEGLGAGTYFPVVESVSSGCAAGGTTIFFEAPEPPVIDDVTVTDPTCAQPSGGVIGVVATGGSFEYSIDGGASFQVGDTFTGLGAGTYAVVIRNGEGCNSAEQTVTLEGPASAPTLEAAVVGLDTCGRGSGSLAIALGGGSAPYTLTVGAEVFPDLGAGSTVIEDWAAATYAVSVLDANGCSAGTSVTVGTVDAPSIDDVAATAPTCATPDGGAIVLSATAAIPGGTLEYSIDAGERFQASASFTGLGAGTYTPAVRSVVSGCVTVATPVVFDEVSGSGPVVTGTTVEPPTCADPAAGTLTVEATGADLRYSLDGGVSFQTASRFTGLGAGVYALVVRNGDGCEATLQITIEGVTSLPGLEVASVAVDTCGRSSGAVQVAVVGGRAPFVVEFGEADFGGLDAGGVLVDGLAAGSYAVRVTDANGCSASRTYVVGAVAAPVIVEVRTTPPTCAAPAGGTVAIVTDGSDETYRYSVDGGASFQAGNTFSGLGAGTYAPVVRAAGDCEAVAEAVTLSAPALPTIASVDAEQPTCAAPEGGRITVAASADVDGYSIDGGDAFQSESTFAGLSAGTYAVVVRNADGCLSETQQVTLAGPSSAPVVATAVLSADSCGLGTGAVRLTPSAGLAPYAITVAGVGYPGVGASGQVVSGLSVGDYTATVTDGGGCTATASFSIGGVSAAVIEAIEADAPTCAAPTGGVIRVQARSPGGAALAYSVDGGDTFQSDARFTGLSAGNYAVVVRGPGRCLTVGRTVAFDDVSGERPRIVEALSQKPTCVAPSSGAIELRAEGTDLVYSVDAGASFQRDPVFRGLGAGTYTAVVRNGDGCESEPRDVTLEAPDAAPEIVGVEIAPTRCDDLSGGSLRVEATGRGLAFSIDGGATFSESSLFEGLRAGDYEVVVRNGEGCVSAPETATVEGPSDVPAVLTQVLALDSCGRGVGAVRITPSGGEGPYALTLDGRDLGDLPADGLTVDALAGGTYAVAVRDVYGCGADASVEVPTTDAPVIRDFRTTDANCEDLFGGAITVFATGDDLGYSVDGGASFSSDQTVGGLRAGRYRVVVRSGAGCVSSAFEVVVGGPTALPEAVVEDVRADTCGRSVGGFTVLPQGPTAVNYRLGDGPTRVLPAAGAKLDDLAAGTYALTVGSEDGCETTQAVVVPAVGAPVVLGLDSTPGTCVAPESGRIDVRAEGRDLRFSLDGGRTFQTSPSFADLAPGDYRVTVRGLGDCEVRSAPVTLPDPEELRPTLTVADVGEPTCDDLSGGRISLAASRPGARYSVDGGDNYQSSPDFGGLRAGDYVALARTADGCVSEPLLVALAGPSSGAPAISEVETAPASCGDLAGGVLRVIAVGSDLRYSLDGGATAQASNQFEGLRAGTYTVTVGNAEGCETTSAPVVVDGPRSLPALRDVDTEPTSCSGAADGALRIRPAGGGEPPYDYSVDGLRDDGADGVFAGLPAGLYVARVTDANGCTAAREVRVEDGPDLGLRLDRTANPTCGERNGRIEVSAAVAGASYTWSDGGRGASRQGLAADRYVVTATTAAGCTDSLVVVLNDAGAPVLGIEGVAPDRCGNGTGVITLTLRSGQAPFAFEIDGRRTDQTTRDLRAGTYRIVATDANGCTASVTAEVPLTGVVAVSATDTVVCTREPVPIFARVDTGAASGYAWSNGDTGPSTRLSAGETATVTATSAEGCTSTATAAVRYGGADEDPRVDYAPGCATDPGSATATVVGYGERDSLYVFGGRTQSSPVFAGVAPGDYDFGVVLQGGCFAAARATLEGATAVGLATVDTAYVDCVPVATVRGSGGAGGPYAFSVDGGAFSADSLVTVARAVTVVVRDGDGCVSDAITLDLPPPPAPVASADVSYEGCEEATGTVRLTSERESSYAWADGFVGAFRQNLPADTYLVRVTDAVTGCVTELSVTVEGVEDLSLEVAGVTAASNCRVPEGTAVVAAAGGVGPYAYAWSHDMTLDGPSAAGLSAGEYTVAVTDGRGCVAERTVSVPGEAGVRLSLASSSPQTCATREDGAVALALSAPDLAGVTVRWADGSSDLDRADLAAGTYVITAVDGNECTDTLRVVVGDDRLRVDSLAVVAAGCDSTGAIDLAVAGGAGAYRATWGDGLGGFGRMGLAPGVYDVRVSDARGCLLDTAVTVGGDVPTVLAADAVTLCPGETRAYDVPYAASAVTWTDETGLTVAMDSVLLLDRAGVFNYDVAGVGACGARGTLTVDVSESALFAQFLVASAAVVGSEVVAIETSVPAPETLRWAVTGPAPVDSLGGMRNEYRWRFDAPGTYALTLEAGLGACVTTLTKTVEIVADSSLLPQAAPAFGELLRFDVAPNPTTGPFTVEADFSAARAVSVRVYALDGRLVLEETEAASDAHRVDMDLGGEEAGTYFVVLTAGVGSWTKAVVLVE